MRTALAAAGLALAFAGAARAESKEVLACYSTCNRTVPNAAKRSACFKECKANAGSASAPSAASSGSSRSQGAATTDPKKLTGAERAGAENDAHKLEMQLQSKAGPQCKSFCSGCGKAGDRSCLTTCTAVVGQYNATRARLQVGGKVQPGQSGHLSGTYQRSQYGGVYNNVEQAKKGMEISMKQCYFEDAIPHMNTIEREWRESIKASRRRGD